ncbi:MAG TPA: hypothetical protein VIL41_05655 [Coriobacteriia bacterium]
MIPVPQLIVGITGAIVGVIGWLFVGIYIQRREARRRARNAGRAVYFELGANLLAIFTALEYGMFGPLSRASYDQLLPELAAWLPADELQALALAYLGQGAYAQVSHEEDLPVEARKMSLSALLDAHRVALDLLRKRVFTSEELDSLDRYASKQQEQLIEAASRPRGA